MTEAKFANEKLGQLNADCIITLSDRVRDPEIARQLVTFFEAHPRLKTEFAGLYMTAKANLISSPVEGIGFAIGRTIRGFFSGLATRVRPAGQSTAQPESAHAVRNESSPGLVWPTLFSVDDPRGFAEAAKQ